MVNCGGIGEGMSNLLDEAAWESLFRLHVTSAVVMIRVSGSGSGVVVQYRAVLV